MDLRYLTIGAETYAIVGHFLLVEEVLKNSVLGMMPDVMGAEYVFTYPYIFMLD